MQLYALDIHDSLIPASKARKQCNYLCLECRGVVRVRAGIHRQPHFFHLKPSTTCHLSGKSMIHLQVQSYFLKCLSSQECQLEVRFPAIDRIADVVWEPKKIIFEVQCSPITAEEIRSRNSDYASQGYRVVWILHDKRFNQYKYSSAELFLRAHPHYFTNINGEGRGIIYDQFDLLLRGKRLGKLSPLPIDVAQVQHPAGLTADVAPNMWSERVARWPIHFSGDFIDQSTQDKNYLSQAVQKECDHLPSQPIQTFSYVAKTLINKMVIRPYTLLFQLLLERVCRG